MQYMLFHSKHVLHDYPIDMFSLLFKKNNLFLNLIICMITFNKFYELSIFLHGRFILRKYCDTLFVCRDNCQNTQNTLS